MKKEEISDKKLLCYLSALVAAVIALILVIALPLSCAAPKVNLFDESIEKIDNPDQGFYRPVYVEVTDGGVKYNANIVNDGTQLYHLRVDISAFSKAVNGVADKELTPSALDGFSGVLQFLRSRGKNAVVRFAYDPKYGGQKDREPSMDTMLKHIEQVSGVLNKFPATVTAVEAGLLGPWGEMHSSKIATLKNKVAIAGKYLEETADGNLAVLVRTPDVIYGALGITINEIDGYAVAQSSPVYRLGMYNDGYLGTENDTGTYTDRAREVRFMSVQNGHLPYGGEVVLPDSKLHDIENCTPEMFAMGLSYLNIEWNGAVIDKWKNTYYTKKCGGDALYYGSTAFDYIQNHMGYRLVLRQSSLKYSAGELKVKLEIENVGFGNLFKSKQTKLILESESGAVTEIPCGTYAGGDAAFSAKCNLSGSYKAYVCFYGEEYGGKPNYAVRLANKDVWSERYKANFIGNVKI